MHTQTGRQTHTHTQTDKHTILINYMLPVGSGRLRASASQPEAATLGVQPRQLDAGLGLSRLHWHRLATLHAGSLNDHITNK